MSYSQQLGYEENFGKLIADTTRGAIDIPAHFDYSPERLRIEINGSRSFVQYNSISQFNDGPDTWDLQPSSGDTVGLRTTENISYSVNYVTESAFAFSINQSLQDGDIVRVGPHKSGSDGWFMEQRGTDHTDNQVDIIELRGGTRTVLASNVELPQPITSFQRYSVRWSWYNVGNQTWNQSYTSGGEQINDTFAKTSNDSSRGPEEANLPICFEVEASGSTTGLELHAGSVAQVILGATKNLIRSTSNEKNRVQLTGNNDTWEPLHALRIKPNASANVQLENPNLLQYTKDAKVQMKAISVDPSKTDASGFGKPNLIRSVDTAVQTTDSVSEIPNDSGTQVDPDSSTNPGGFEVQYNSIRPTAQDFSQGVIQNDAAVSKSPIPPGDVIVFIARSPDHSGYVDFAYTLSEDW